MTVHFQVVVRFRVHPYCCALMSRRQHVVFRKMRADAGAGRVTTGFNFIKFCFNVSFLSVCHARDVSFQSLARVPEKSGGAGLDFFSFFFCGGWCCVASRSACGLVPAIRVRSSSVIGWSVIVRPVSTTPASSLRCYLYTYNSFVEEQRFLRPLP